MTNKTIGVAVLAITLAGGAMGQTSNPEKVQQAAVTIPLSTGTAINASLLGSLDSEKASPGMW